jgi:hypothetical protein
MSYGAMSYGAVHATRYSMFAWADIYGSMNLTMYMCTSWRACRWPRVEPWFLRPLQPLDRRRQTLDSSPGEKKVLSSFSFHIGFRRWFQNLIFSEKISLLCRYEKRMAARTKIYSMKNTSCALVIVFWFLKLRVDLIRVQPFSPQFCQNLAI